MRYFTLCLAGLAVVGAAACGDDNPGGLEGPRDSVTVNLVLEWWPLSAEGFIHSSFHYDVLEDELLGDTLMSGFGLAGCYPPDACPVATLRCTPDGAFIADDYRVKLIGFHPVDPPSPILFWVYEGIARFGDLRCTSAIQSLNAWETWKKRNDSGDEVWIPVQDSVHHD